MATFIRASGVGEGASTGLPFPRGCCSTTASRVRLECYPRISPTIYSLDMGQVVGDDGTQNSGPS